MHLKQATNPEKPITRQPSDKARNGNDPISGLGRFTRECNCQKEWILGPLTYIGNSIEDWSS